MINQSFPVFIAEVGVNHDGSLLKAKKLVDAAVEAGATIVKFQTFKTEKLVTKSAEMAEYQKKNIGKQDSQYEMLKKLELSYDDFVELKKYCVEKKIEFLSTGFDIDSLKFLASLNPNCWKIPSGEITNLPYLEFIAAQTGLVFISTGMATMEEVDEAFKVISNIRKSDKDIYVMHCTTQYPAELKDINLNVLKKFNEKFKNQIGYSDHSMGIEVSLGAIALGSKIIEKHITLDTSAIGPDHKASILPQEFKMLVDLGRNIFLSLGTDIKNPTQIEIQNKAIARKSIVAKKMIKKGETFSVENLDIKRPGTGLSPMCWYKIMGRAASRDYDTDDLINESL
ncbi:MAG: N-acetylneuraminate synthase [Bacteriovoracaceae bacterium]|nr:N-acetylneuraminate synthase [Bacteriovoracaceae bacterium]